MNCHVCGEPFIEGQRHVIVAVPHADSLGWSKPVPVHAHCARPDQSAEEIEPLLAPGAGTGPSVPMVPAKRGPGRPRRG